MDSRKRDAWLDGLRAVAVLLVLGRHVELPEAPSAWLAAWVRGGWVGVDLFFVLSGFLVSGLLFREYQQRQTLTVSRFLIRRGLRLYPAFYLLLAFTAALAPVLPTSPAPFTAYLAEIFFVQNYRRPVWNHTWSLAVEEHFYLALPVLLLCLLRFRRGQADPFRGLVGITVTVAVGLALFRCVHGYYRPFHPRTHLFPTHLRVDSLLGGVLLAYVYHVHRIAFARWVDGRRGWLFVAGALCFVPAFVFDVRETWFIYTLGLTLFTMGGVLVIAAGVGTAPLPARLLAPIGGASYSIYLWHMPVLVGALPWCEQMLGYRLADPLRLAVYVAGSVAAGTVMARATEMPVLRLRDRWFPSKPASSPQASLRACGVAYPAGSQTRLRAWRRTMRRSID